MSTLKINEVEALAGISKKNIRFYEEQGLLAPRRNAENGYRVYGEEEVQLLLRIKLLRKLGVSIEEIRSMLSGTHTLGDGMRRHLITLERERRNLEQSIVLCEELQREETTLQAFDAQQFLSRMEQMEQQGALFQNKQQQDVRVRYIAPVIITAAILVLLLGLSALMLWLYWKDAETAPPMLLLVIMLLGAAAVGVGVVLALRQRIREIGKGEIDDARRY